MVRQPANLVRHCAKPKSLGTKPSPATAAASPVSGFPLQCRREYVGTEGCRVAGRGCYDRRGEHHSMEHGDT